jgi:hypothetical protein
MLWREKTSKKPGVPLSKHLVIYRSLKNPQINETDRLKLWSQGKTPDPEVNGKQNNPKVCEK